MDALRYWVTEMYIDGFRFDLASILGRGQDGEVMSNPPLLERIAAEPVLANTKLIAEAWDAAGLYQVGSFPNWGRWAEWNGRFRDDIRRFVRGDPGMIPVLATRMASSSDLYQHDGRAPYHSVKFITSHDGFTLFDLVTYEKKYNEANGQDNQDGDSEPFSWNCGIEGPMESEDVLRLRRRQMRNLVALLMLSQGVPMILSGDESGRTQQGNNNAFCQDNDLSWFDWTRQQADDDFFILLNSLLRFVKRMLFYVGTIFLNQMPFPRLPGMVFNRIVLTGLKIPVPSGCTW
jgi:glycogen operon protein